jgi:hypothetical protein
MNGKTPAINVLKLLSIMVCLVLLVGLGCATPQSEGLPTATPTATAQIKQWASGARAGSIITGIPVGKPNTLICMASAHAEQAESLDIYFDQPVVPSVADLHMLAELSADVTIQLLDSDGNAHDVDYSVEQTHAECPFLYQVKFSGYDKPIAGIRMTSSGEFFEDWNSIDAIEMTGTSSGAEIDLSSTLLKPSATPLPTATPTPAPIGERAYFDRTDDYEGEYQLHVVYALFQDDDDLHRDTDGSIARSVNLANEWFKEQTDGSTLRFDTYEGELDITFVQFESTAKDALENYREVYDTYHVEYNLVIEDFYIDYIVDELASQAFYQKGKYYIFYLEEKHPNNCGFSFHSNFPGVFFLGTTDCGYGRLGVDAYAWGTEFVMLHEVLHGIGFTPECAPHNVTDNPHHVNDSSIDLMYPYAGAGQQMVLDLGHDDYFKHGIEGCADLANSAFLEPLPENPEVPKDWPDNYLLDKYTYP